MTFQWIGIVEVRSHTGHDVLHGAKGAFVNVVALANDKHAFEQLVVASMNEYDLSVIGLTDVELLTSRLAKTQILPELEALAEQLTEEYPIQFDEFQTYRNE